MSLPQYPVTVVNTAFYLRQPYKNEIREHYCIIARKVVDYALAEADVLVSFWSKGDPKYD
ncbi:uncharacterized protein N7458_005132 [Penicillium daleae]|uniref:Uncharacterized protein n=1 Tax=Penicillium daleae TaxID=63821 RepID=A0AAD6C8B2_9EURO|nr:uncharacterized protein N7458_005132 [Penicillium daleae]KAJ5454176.1 hypothetical protein N7458_005132 [Penicillium daleae]